MFSETKENAMQIVNVPSPSICG